MNKPIRPGDTPSTPQDGAHFPTVPMPVPVSLAQAVTLSRLASAGFAFSGVEASGAAVATLTQSGRTVKRIRVGLDGGARTA